MPPIINSLIAFGIAVAFLTYTEGVRSRSGALNFLLVLASIVGSIVIGSFIPSTSYEASGGYIFYLWLAYAFYAIYKILSRKRDHKRADDGANEQSGGA